MNNHRLIKLPKKIINIVNLRELDLSYNKLKTLPENVCNLKNLKEFGFTMKVSVMIDLQNSYC